MIENQQKILDYLKLQSRPITTRVIARNTIFKNEYDEKDAYYNGRAIVVPGRDVVQSTYQQLKQLQNKNLISQVGRGMWKININK